MEFSTADQSYLSRQIRMGQALLVLGAGASIQSTNRFGKPLKNSTQLAERLCTEAGLPFSGESLPTVYEAIKGSRLSDIQINNILREEYSDTTPSQDLIDLFRVSWRRVYTFNIDDTLDNITSLRSGQRRRYYNGMIDRVADFEGPLNLHVIYLHGQATKPEHGLIFSETEYSKAALNEHLYWYSRAGQDYLSCPVFIESRLDEPVLWSQIERAKRMEGSTAGLGFVVTPAEITTIQAQSLKNKGLVHIKANLAELNKWLSRTFRDGVTVTDIVKATSLENKDLSSLTREDINAAHYLCPIVLPNIINRLAQMPPSEIKRVGRTFLRGFPPTWDIAASDIPVYLHDCNIIYDKMKDAIENHTRLFVLTGQAGSGKTTAIMMVLLKLLQSGNRKVYEVSGDVRSVQHIFSVLKKLAEPCIVYIGDLFLYGDHLADDLERLRGTDIIVVTSARSGEWNEHFARHFCRTAEVHKFSRFSDQDYQPLLQRLNQYVPAPAFKQLTAKEQLTRLAKSRRQLLIALHETTQSENFAEVMETEYRRLPDEDTKRLFVIAGIATMARVGISVDTATAVYGKHCRRAFESALGALDGIVELTESNRLVARHELYVRQIVEHVIDFERFSAVLCDILDVFARYEIPVIRKINRTDGYLFKTLVNHDFIFKAASVHGDPSGGKSIYERYEIDFQLDGHLWLQYGLYLINLNEFDDAHKMLKRSIEAYPENPFALHALSHLQLRIASHSKSFDKYTENLIQEAITRLELLNARATLADDQYPLVTMAMGHVGALAAHSQHRLAKSYAAKYYRRLQEMGRRIANEPIAAAEQAMVRYVTLGEPPGKLFGPATPRRWQANRKKNA